MERTLVLIKPDAMVKKLGGNIISELDRLGLKMIGLKLVNVQKELAEQHYYDIAERHSQEIFEKLVQHLTGKLHGNENVIAIVYEGENAIQKIRDVAGATHPEKSDPISIRGKYGRVHTETDCFENVLHASSEPSEAEREIKLWFDDGELVE